MSQASRPASLFVPHGAPTFALRPMEAGQALATLGQRLKNTKGIVIVSPHWQTSIPTVGTAPAFETIHDFNGFPEELYQIHYPAKGNSNLCKQLVFALDAVGAPVCEDRRRGLDHGAWVPLRMMFPEADVPVVPLSLLREGGPRAAYRLGQALQPLTHNGYTVIGTGSLTHNLGDYRALRDSDHEKPPAYITGFADWMADKAENRDLASLLDYRQLAPEGAKAHPTEEHLLPFFVALGAAGPKAIAKRIHRSVQELILSMDAYEFSPAG